MENVNINKYLSISNRSLKDYLLLIRSNRKIFLIILLFFIIMSILYIFNAEKIYKSTVTLRINLPQQNILQNTTANAETNILDRFTAMEIEIINSYDTREKVAEALIDTFNLSKNKSIFNLLKSNNENSVDGHLNLEELTGLLEDISTVQQVNGIDVIQISVESPSAKEAALIANTYVDQYKSLNLEINRKQLSTVRKFLEKQVSLKQEELNQADDELKKFKQSGGIIKLDEQSKELISQLAGLDAQRDAAKIDLVTSSEMLVQYKTQLKNNDPQLADYLESQTSQAYIDVLQKQIAELQMNKDLAMANSNANIDVTEKINSFDQKINGLKEKLNAKYNEIKTSAYVGSPDQVKDLTNKLIEEEMRNHSLKSKLTELQSIINDYEYKLRGLPAKSIELAKYERKSESAEQLYVLLDKKYQESAINELSKPGNVLIISKGRASDKPARPKKFLIAVIGILTGLVSAFSFIIVKDYFNDKIKSPDDISMEGLNVLAWLPYIKELQNSNSDLHPYLKLDEINIPAVEAFRSVKARIQFSNNGEHSPKTILVTSAAEQEGKTLVSINLAISFSNSGKKTLLIDCDLRRPKIHTIMQTKKTPGLVDYLFKKASLEEVIKKTDINNLEYLTAGTYPFYPTEIFQSHSLQNFIKDLRNIYDNIIIDSAPIVAVIDSEILSKIVDGSILVVSANKTETRLMLEAMKLIRNKNSIFFGTILNNFNYKNGYGYYNKYYYNYTSREKKFDKDPNKYKFLE